MPFIDDDGDLFGVINVVDVLVFAGDASAPRPRTPSSIWAPSPPTSLTRSRRVTLLKTINY